MKNMKGLTIPTEVMEKTNLGHEITLQVFESVMVLKSTNMTALDTVKTIESLERITTDLYETLLAKFPTEDDCENCTFCEGFMEDNIEVPDWAKEVCGLESDTKFCICAEEDSGRITLEPVDYEHDITDIDEDMLERLSAMGICLGELNESIMTEEVVYGK